MTSRRNGMTLSVIIPVHNGGSDLLKCLGALAQSSYAPEELIVVDDASTDASATLARKLGARVISLGDVPHGPAFARNRGADIARGDVLVFLDADVTVHADTLARIEQTLTAHPEVSAVFGSYDANPPARSWVSLYKNLLHHYTHQHSSREATTFWAGCGAIRRNVFAELGGFDERYTRPSIEDIELGGRLARGGKHVWLCPEIQVAHLKRWSLTSLLRADICDRALPWSMLIARERHLPAQLNLDWRNRASALAAWLILASGLLGWFVSLAWFVLVGALVVLVALNCDLYRFLARQGGVLFAGAAMALHGFYFLYSSFVFVLVLARVRLTGM